MSRKRFAEWVTYNWASNSAIYHVVPNCIFLKDLLAFRVNSLHEDTTGRNLCLENPRRIKDMLFKEIRGRYNGRINQPRIGGNRLLFQRLRDSDTSNFSLRAIRFSKNDMDIDRNDLSGRFRIFPRTFVCRKCYAFHLLNFSKGVHEKCTCGGKLDQIKVVKFCKECGKIDELYPRCKQCANENKEQGTMKLLRSEKDDITKWRWQCANGHEEDILKAYCNHQDRRNKVDPHLLPDSAPPAKFGILTIRESSVFTPQVVTSVDIKDTSSITDIGELECILFAIQLDKFRKFEDEAKEKEKSVLQIINERFRMYNSPEEKESFFETVRMCLPDATDEEIETKFFAEKCKMGQIREVLDEVSKAFPPDEFDKETFNNYNALKGLFGTDSSSVSYSDAVSSDPPKVAEWEGLKKKFKLKEVTYLENIRLVSAAIGLVRGIGRAGDDFIPHFEPLWDDTKMIVRDKFSAFINPYDTEGLLIDFDKGEIHRWLEENDLIPTSMKSKSPEEILLLMPKDSEVFRHVKTLLHTLCHVLIKKSSLHTGIDEKSCGEMLFPNNGAILIFSTSNINIGGFGHIFDNYLVDLLEESDFELRQCIYDPVCNSDDGSRGSCFSCLHLPEHVCDNFNQDLDRDILKAENRYKSSFW